MLNEEEFVINANLSTKDLTFHPPTCGTSWELSPTTMLEAVVKTNREIIIQMNQNNEWEASGIPPLLKHIPPKNLSGAIGECLGSNYCILNKSDIRKNLHEAGSPDFLPYFTGTEKWIKKPTKIKYKKGGFDTKGCKISNLKFMEVCASSHHDQTNTILVTAWQDFEGIPQIVACFYTNRIKNSDWKIGSIPKGNGARPTSSAQFLKSGLEKLRKGWMLIHQSVSPPQKESDIQKYGLQPLVGRRVN